jgi:hypothetical protein
VPEERGSTLLASIIASLGSNDKLVFRGLYDNDDLDLGFGEAGGVQGGDEGAAGLARLWSVVHGDLGNNGMNGGGSSRERP